MLSGKISCYLLESVLNSDQDLALFLQKQILTGLQVTNIYQNRTMNISLFNYSMLGYISQICSKSIGRIVNISLVSYFFVIGFVSITYWKS